MKQPKSKLLIAGLTFLSIGTLLLCKVYVLQRTIYKLTPLKKIPVNLTLDADLKETLKISRDGNYRIWLNFDKVEGLKDLECKLLLNEDKTYCLGVAPLLDVDWEIIEDNDVLVSEGNSSEFTSGDYGSTIRKEIGEFEAKNGNDYEFKMHVNQDALDLNDLNPKLEIGLHPLDYEQDMNTETLLLILSYINFGVAALLIIVWLILKLAKV